MTSIRDGGSEVDPMYDAATGTYRASFDPEVTDPSTVVVLTVLEVRDVDPSNLEKLNHSLDPDCLDGLFAPRSDGSSRTGGRVVFQYAGFEVTVRSTGEVVLDPD